MPKEVKGGFFSRVKTGLSKTSNKLSNNIKSLFSLGSSGDAINFNLEDLEDILVGVDIGFSEASKIAKKVLKNSCVSEEVLLRNLRDEVFSMLSGVKKDLFKKERKLSVFVFCGINGAGKTTSVGKVAYKLSKSGYSVLIAACDTFRAAAVEQLTVWADKSGCDIYFDNKVSDASSVAYRAAQKAIDGDYDFLLIDTAGRLHNQENFMSELEKLQRTLKKVDSSFPHENVMVFDATIGQIALDQLEIFNKRVGIDGLIVTKLDGTAKGGVLLSAVCRHKVGVYALGLGESVEDLVEFDAMKFSSALVGLGESTVS